LPPKVQPQDIQLDAPLPDEFLNQWTDWKRSLDELLQISVQHFKPKAFGLPTHIILHAFSNASKDAIGHAIYLHVQNYEGAVHVSFVKAQSLVALFRA
jgi:hypothetical protein